MYYRPTHCLCVYSRRRLGGDGEQRVEGVEPRQEQVVRLLLQDARGQAAVDGRIQVVGTRLISHSLLGQHCTVSDIDEILDIHEAMRFENVEA